MTRFKVPLFMRFGGRPVKFVPTSDGGLDICGKISKIFI